MEAVKECMKVLFYRDARSMNEYSIAVVDGEGVQLKEDEKLENQSWAFADRIRGVRHAGGVSEMNLAVEGLRERVCGSVWCGSS